MRIGVFVPFLAVTLIVTACGGSSSNSGEESCLLEGRCVDFPFGTPVSTAQSSCTAVQGRYVGSLCTTANRIGTCTHSSLILVSGAQIRYYGSGYTLVTAQDECALTGGTFVPN